MSLACFFPGQGAQYVGMGKDFWDEFAIVREYFEQADDLLQMTLSKVIFEGPEEALTRTDMSQLAIFVTSTALYAVLERELGLQPVLFAGLSLGEYSVLFASKKIGFEECLHLVKKRGEFMSHACDETQGGMAVLLGLEGDVVEEKVRELDLPKDLWVANFNCPGQVVVSGTLKGIEAVQQAAPSWGAKRVIPLKVHGAFHSGLMESAETRLKYYIDQVSLKNSSFRLFANVTGEEVTSHDEIRRSLTAQVTHPVRFESCIREMVAAGAATAFEVGPGKTLGGMIKKGGLPEVLSLNTVEDLKKFEKEKVSYGF